VNSVYAQMLPAMHGRLFIEMSTVRPKCPRRWLRRWARRRGAFIECPVGGTVGPAREGKLFGFVGGEAAMCGRARPILVAALRRSSTSARSRRREHETRDQPAAHRFTGRRSARRSPSSSISTWIRRARWTSSLIPQCADHDEEPCAAVAGRARRQGKRATWRSTR